MADEKTINKSGTETTEFVVAKSGSFWGTVGIVVGSIISIGSLVASIAGADTQLGMVVGAVVGIAGSVQKVLIDRGYINSRTAVKVSFNEKEENV